MTIPDKVITPFMGFIQKCVTRLKLGQEIYGTRMFNEYNGVRLCQEAKEEIFDVVNYAFALHERLDRLEKVASKVDLMEMWEEENGG